MKVSMFHLFSHRELPDDFEKRYHSVWVDPPWWELSTPEQYERFYRWSVEEMVYAASLGIDGICTNEHHQNAYGGTASPNIFGGILAWLTQEHDVAIVQMGSTLPTTFPPIRVAEEYAILDVISGGRLIAGMPVGTPMDANLCYGITPIEQRERYYEAHDLIIKAWTADEIFPWNGKYFQLPMVNIWPRPIQKPHPPVWVPGVSSVSTWDFVARNGHAYCVLSAFAGAQGIRGAASLTHGFLEVVEKHGQEPNPHRVGFALPVFVSETDAQAEKDYESHIRYMWTKLTHIAPEFWGIPGYQDYRSLRAMLERFGSQNIADERSLGEWSFSEYVERQIVIAGSPSTVRETLAELAKDLKVGHFMVLLSAGSMPKELAFKNVELFCREVLPGLRDIWSEWENPWWPERLVRSRAKAPAGAPAGN